MTTPGSGRTLRLCDVCGGLDDAPRHVTGVLDGGVPPKEFLDSLPEGTPVGALVELLDPATVVRHMDCCAEQGCQLCASVVASSGGSKDAQLVEFLESGGADNLFDQGA